MPAKSRTALLFTLAGAVLLSGGLTGCGGSKSAVLEQANTLAAEIKAAAPMYKQTTLQFTQPKNISASKVAGTPDKPVTMRVTRLLDKEGKILEGVKGYKAASLPDAIIITDGGHCASVTGTVKETLDVDVVELPSCPAV